MPGNSGAAGTALSVIHITSVQSYFPDLREILQYRRLAWVLAHRNIKLRYTQTALGSIWIILQPLLLTGILTLVFGVILSLPSDGVPYGLFTFSGMVLWSAFQRGVGDAGVSLANSGNIVLKVYFPRVLIPASSIMTTLFDLVIMFAGLLIVILIFGKFPGFSFLFAVVPIFTTLTLAFALGLWIAIVDAVFRDMRVVTPTALQVLFYVSPIMYSEAAVPERWAGLYSFNPMVGIMRSFRWATISGTTPPGVFDVVWPLGVTLVLLLAGLMLFSRLENFAVDQI